MLSEVPNQNQGNYILLLYLAFPPYYLSWVSVTSENHRFCLTPASTLQFCNGHGLWKLMQYQLVAQVSLCISQDAENSLSLFQMT